MVQLKKKYGNMEKSMVYTGNYGTLIYDGKKHGTLGKKYGTIENYGLLHYFLEYVRLWVIFRK